MYPVPNNGNAIFLKPKPKSYESTVSINLKAFSLSIGFLSISCSCFCNSTQPICLHKYIKNLVDYEKSKPSNLENEKKIEEEQSKLEDKKKGDKDKSKLKNNLEEKTINDIGKEKEILIKERLKSLSSYLNNQKLKILKTYEKLLESNKKYSLSNNSNNEKKEMRRINL